jgi:hypothetical protein
MDDINNPKYYKHYAIEPIEFIMKNDLPYAEGNVIKYICRWRAKNTSNTKKLEDLQKAKRYVEFLIDNFKETI